MKKESHECQRNDFGHTFTSSSRLFFCIYSKKKFTRGDRCLWARHDSIKVLSTLVALKALSNSIICDLDSIYARIYSVPSHIVILCFGVALLTLKDQSNLTHERTLKNILYKCANIRPIACTVGKQNILRSGTVGNKICFKKAAKYAPETLKWKTSRPLLLMK